MARTPRHDRWSAIQVQIQIQGQTGRQREMVVIRPHRRWTPRPPEWLGREWKILPLTRRRWTSTQTGVDWGCDPLLPAMCLLLLVVVHHDDHPHADTPIGTEQRRAVDPSIAAILVGSSQPSDLGRHASTIGQCLGEFFPDARAATDLGQEWRLQDSRNPERWRGKEDS